MKRPLAVTGFVYLAASAAALFLNSKLLLFVGAAVLLCIAVSLKSVHLRKNGVVPLVLITVFAALVSVGVYTSSKVTPTEKLAGKSAVIEAELTELPYMQNDRYYYSVNARTLKSRDGKIYHDVKLLVYCDEPLNASPSDIITADVRLSATKNSYDISKGIIYRAGLPYPRVTRVSPQENKPLYYYVLMLRQLVCEKIDSLLPQDTAAFVKAFLLGDSHSLDGDTLNSLRTAGLSHIIVVSGLHVSVLVNLLMMLFIKLLRLKKRTSLLICGVIILLYMALAGFPPSVVRAGIMHLVVLLCAYIFRRSDPMAALGLSLLIILAAKPYAATDISLLLSFSATFGILVSQKPMAAWINARLFTAQKSSVRRRSIILSAGRLIADVITVTISAVVFSLPVTIIYFRQVPLYGVLSSVLVAFTVPVLMVSVLLMIVIGFLSVFAAASFSYLTVALTRQILFTAKTVSELPFSRVTFYYSFVPMWVGLCVILAAALYLQRNMRFRVRIFALSAALTFVFSLTADYFIRQDAVSIYIPDTGQGVTVMLSCGDTSALLACGGDYTFINDTANEIRTRSSERVSYLLLLDKDRKISSFAERLLSDIHVDTAGVYDPDSFNEGVREALRKCSRVISFSSLDGTVRVMETGGFRIESLRKYKTCAAFVRVKNMSILLCCDGTDCEDLPGEWRSADMLIVNGELKNTALLHYDILVISDGEKYSDITYRELDTAAVVRRTYEDGSVTIKLDRNNHLTEVRESNWLS
ncbi:MAG: ComEC/Rec2 family competence protein [Clostridia bacterium]|nr:ComEC/Rec2 family competence protein [Clostridia bacterium]